MTATSLIIVADRGSLRVYRVQETPMRDPHLELVQAFEVTDVMDAASTQHETPMTDWPALEAEMYRRVCKELATEIAKIVERNPGGGGRSPRPNRFTGRSSSNCHLKFASESWSMSRPTW
jgi:hypothetical protein